MYPPISGVPNANIDSLPRKILDIALAVTEANISADKVGALKSFNKIISSAKKTPPSGVLNIAAIAAPEPAAVKTLLLASDNPTS